MSIYRQTFRNNFSIVKEFYAHSIDHWHQDVEIVYVLSGQAQIKIGNTLKICKAGDMAVVHSGEIHHVRSLENSSLYICIFDIDIIRKLHFEMKYTHNFISAEEQKTHGIEATIREIFDEIYQENADKGTWNDVVIHAGLMRLYALLVRNFERANADKSHNIVKFQHFQEALFYIEKEFAHNITLADVARAINYNPNYVSYLFVVYTGENFKKYLDSFRVNKAIELIRQSGDTFTDISAHCGFSSIRTFNNVFRKITGMTPSQLRQAGDTFVHIGDFKTQHRI